MKIHITKEHEAILTLSELIISNLRKEQHLAGSEIAFLDILEAFRNDLLGIRNIREKEEGFRHE